MFRIIINPKAGAGRASAILPQVEQMLRDRGIEFDTVKTAAPWDGAVLAAQAAAAGIDTAVIVGGDGTFFEAANGLTDSNTTMMIVPCGTGNDLIRAIPLPREPLAALRAQLDSQVRTIDVGKVGSYRFLNVAGTGFDVEVLRQTERYKDRYHGILPYLLGVARTVRLFRPFHAVLEVDGARSEGEYTIISLANGQYIGGGMRVARKADPFDGRFDVISVPALPKWKVCLLLPLFLFGLHDLLPYVRRELAENVRIRSLAMTVNLDGELRDMDDAQFRLLAGALRMALPKDQS